MNSLPEPLRVVLRDFCHVEWFELDELASIVRSGAAKFDSVLLEQQLNKCLASGAVPVEEINVLTANEFESTDEAKAWLMSIRDRVFGEKNS